MPVVTIDMWEGRSVEQKRELVKAMTHDHGHGGHHRGQSRDAAHHHPRGPQIELGPKPNSFV